MEAKDLLHLVKELEFKEDKPIGKCEISTAVGNYCFNLTQDGCAKVASNVGGTYNWKANQKC